MKANETKGIRSPTAPTDGRRGAGGGRGAAPRSGGRGGSCRSAPCTSGRRPGQAGPRSAVRRPRARSTTQRLPAEAAAAVNQAAAGRQQPHGQVSGARVVAAKRVATENHRRRVRRGMAKQNCTRCPAGHAGGQPEISQADRCPADVSWQP